LPWCDFLPFFPFLLLHRQATRTCTTPSAGVLPCQQIEQKHGGLAMLAPTNIINLNDFDVYLGQLKDRVNDAANA
jgi:hypothetical protein